MATSPDAEESHDAAEPITDRVYDNSWSANLEKPEHAEDRELVVAQAVDADLTVSYVDKCGCGGHVTRVHVE